MNPSAEGLLAMADTPVLLAQSDPVDAPADDTAPAEDTAPAQQPAGEATAPSGEATTEPTRPAGQGTATAPAGEGTADASRPSGAGTADRPAGLDLPGAGTLTAGGTDADPFLGGTSVQLDFPPPGIGYDVLTNRINAIVDRLAEANKISSRPAFDIFNPEYERGESNLFNSWQLKILLPQDEARAVAQALKTELQETPVFPAATQIGGRVAGDTTQQAIIALVASSFFIVAYIWLRFQHLTFGLAAIVALLHDLAITVGILALSAFVAPYLGFLMIDPFKISLSVMAAILTVMGYSLNDTIVVFDRIREVRGKSPDLTESMVNLSVNQTLSRTLLTGITTMMVVLILYIWGGPGLHAFAFTLLVGIIVGTFSSIYIAAPVLLWRSNRAKGSERRVTRQGQPQTSATA